MPLFYNTQFCAIHYLEYIQELHISGLHIPVRPFVKGESYIA